MPINYVDPNDQGYARDAEIDPSIATQPTKPGIPMPSFPGPSGAVVSAPARSAGDLDALSKQYGFAVDPSDVQAYLNGRGSVSDYDARMKARAGPDFGKAQPAAASSGGSSAPAFANTSPSFDDPASRLVEDYALDRFRQRQNPDPNSGTALYEKYAKELIDTLKQPVYSAGDESIIKGRAFDALEQERGQTKQRWMQELSRRGIQPSSGVALDGLLKIDNHYAGLRSTVDSQFAQNAIDQTRQQRTQVLDTYGQLANSEEGRLREALTYATIPKQMQDNSFQQGLQLVGAGGSPQSLLQSALGIYNSGQYQAQNASQNKAAQMNAIMQLIGLGVR